MLTESLYKERIEYKNKLVERGKDKEVMLTLAIYDEAQVHWAFG
jgi:hypothetical protein